MAESRKNGGGLFAAARKLAKVAVKRAIERLTGMPLSGDPWAGRPMLESAKQFPVGFPTVAAPMAAAPMTAASPVASPPPAPAPPRPPVAAPAVARAPVAKPAPPPPQAKAKDKPRPAARPAEAQKQEVRKPAPPVVPTPPPVIVRKPPRVEEEPWGLLDLEETPQTYGQDDVGLLVRNPAAIFLWWEITPAAWDRARAELRGEGRLIARLAVRARGEDGHWHEFHQDHHLDWDHGRRYFATPAADAHISAHIGLVSHDGRFANMISAPSITVPATGVSSREADDWMFVEPVGGPSLLSGGFSARRSPIIRARGSARAVALATGSATLGHAAAGGEAPTNEGLPASTFKASGLPAAGSSWPGGLASASASGSPSGSSSSSSWSGSPTR